jgi:hypothetical protein
MELSGAAFNLKTALPIVIGTIPLRANFGELMPPNGAEPPYWDKNPSPAINPVDPNISGGFTDVGGFHPLPFAPGGGNGVPYPVEIPGQIPIPPYPSGLPGSSAFIGMPNQPIPSAPIFQDYPDLRKLKIIIKHFFKFFVVDFTT